MLRNPRKLLSLLAGLVALAVLTCPIAAATAGEYEVWSCRGPDGQPLSTEAWKPRSFDSAPGDLTFTDDCVSGGPVTLSVTPASTDFRRPHLEYTFDLPAGEKIIEYRLSRGLRAAAAVASGYHYVAAVRLASGTGSEDFGCASTLAFPNFMCNFLGSLTDPDAPGNLTVTPSTSLDGLGVFAACNGVNGCTSPFAFAADVALFQAAVVIEDDTPPVLAELGGSLAGGKPVHGDAGLFVRATDDNAGVASIALDIDGSHFQTIGISSGACSEPYVRPRPCPADAGRIFEVDTSTLAEGTHVASGTVTDAAGNQTPFGPVSFTVEEPDPEPSPVNGAPAVRTPNLGLDSRSVSHRPGKPAVVSGRLTTPSGQPIAGAQLLAQSLELTSNGERARSLPAVTTGADGRFRIRLGGQGSRQVQVTFSPGPGQEVTARASAIARTRLELRFNASPNRIRRGQAVTFRGRLLGAGSASRGVPLFVQAKVAGRWSTIATIETRQGGQFRWRYRFRYVERDALFSFRIVARGGPGWPWPSRISAVRRIRINGGSR